MAGRFPSRPPARAFPGRKSRRGRVNFREAARSPGDSHRKTFPTESIARADLLYPWAWHFCYTMTCKRGRAAVGTPAPASDHAPNGEMRNG